MIMTQTPVSESKPKSLKVRVGGGWAGIPLCGLVQVLYKIANRTISVYLLTVNRANAALLYIWFSRTVIILRRSVTVMHVLTVTFLFVMTTHHRFRMDVTTCGRGIDQVGKTNMSMTTRWMGLGRPLYNDVSESPGRRWWKQQHSLQNVHLLHGSTIIRVVQKLSNHATEYQSTG